jgi:translation initiation factor 3 subunit C
LRSEDEPLSTKVLLYLIYNHAINRRDKAKDLFVMTNLSETITSRDFDSQVSYNRALVQLGISSFHQGNLYEAQQILSSICSTGKSRE